MIDSWRANRTLPLGLLLELSREYGVSLDYLVFGRRVDRPRSAEPSEILTRLRFASGVPDNVSLTPILRVTFNDICSWRESGEVPLPVLAVYCLEHGVSLTWLLTGVGRAPARQ